MFWNKLKKENKELREHVDNQRKEINRLLHCLSVGPESIKQKAVDKEVEKRLAYFAEQRKENENLHNQIEIYRKDIKYLSEDNEELRKELLGDKKSSERIVRDKISASRKQWLNKSYAILDSKEKTFTLTVECPQCKTRFTSTPKNMPQIVGCKCGFRYHPEQGIEVNVTTTPINESQNCPLCSRSESDSMPPLKGLLLKLCPSHRKEFNWTVP